MALTTQSPVLKPPNEVLFRPGVHGTFRTTNILLDLDRVVFFIVDLALEEIRLQNLFWTDSRADPSRARMNPSRTGAASPGGFGPPADL